MAQELLLLSLPPATAQPAALSVAAQAHARGSILAPLLNVSSSVDVLAVMRAGDSFFAGLRGPEAAAGGTAKVRRTQGRHFLAERGARVSGFSTSKRGLNPDR